MGRSTTISTTDTIDSTNRYEQYSDSCESSPDKQSTDNYIENSRVERFEYESLKSSSSRNLRFSPYPIHNIRSPMALTVSMKSIGPRDPETSDLDTENEDSSLAMQNPKGISEIVSSNDSSTRGTRDIIDIDSTSAHMTYEQLSSHSHNFSKPSTSNSRKAQGHNSRYYPYLRRNHEVASKQINNNAISQHDKSEDMTIISSYSNGGTVANVHTNGIWTPSAPTCTSSYGNGSQSYQINDHQYPHSNEQEHISVPTPTSTTGTESPNNQNPQSLQSVHNSSNMAIVRPSAATPATSSTSNYLYDMTTTAGQHSNNSPIPNGFHHNHSQFAYKIETSPSRPYPNQICENPIPVEASIKNAFFTQDKVDTLCDVMLRDRNYTMLAHILHGLTKDIQESENVLRARAALAYQSGKYEELYNILESRMFSQRHHRELQELYQNARYSEAGKVRGRDLGAVDKYRIRRKHSLPRSIWDGESTSYTFKDRDRKLLIEAYTQCQYPNGEMKKGLQEITGLDKKQIDNWFKNRRQRERPKDEKGKKKPKRIQKDIRSSTGSPGSVGSGLIINQNYSHSYHSPTLGDETMDIKYSQYMSCNNPTSPPTLTAAQMKSYNSMSDLATSTQGHHTHHHLHGGSVSPNSTCAPITATRGKKALNKARSSKNAMGLGKGAMLCEKIFKRKKHGAKYGNNDGGSAMSLYSGNYYEIYNLSAHSGNGNNGRSRTPNVSNLADDDSPIAQDLVSSAAHNLQSLQNYQSQQQFSGSCSTVLLNQPGWGPNWHHAHASGSAAGSAMESPYTMLPSLASFSHHPHHGLNLNSEPRIQVQ